MLYCNYSQYKAGGGTLDEAAFDPLCAQASKLIDRFTFGRAEPHAATCSDCKTALAVACVAIVQKFEQSNAVAASSGAAPGIVSVNNDGFAVTFSTGALSEHLAAEAQGILTCCLGCDPHGLLYRGCF